MFLGKCHTFSRLSLRGIHGRSLSRYSRFALHIPVRKYVMIGRSSLEEEEQFQKEMEEEMSKDKPFSEEYRKSALMGVDRKSKANQHVDMDEVLQRIEKHEAFAKLFVKNRGVALIEPFDRPDDFFDDNLGTRVLTPAIRQLYDEDEKQKDQLIATRQNAYKERALKYITKAISLRETHWGHNHPHTLTSHIIHLSILEIIGEKEELHDRLLFWLDYCDKNYNHTLRSMQELPKSMEHLDPLSTKEVFEAEIDFISKFYGCIVRLMTDVLVAIGEPQEAIELSQVAMKMLSKKEQDNFVYLVLIGRNLANAYMEQGRVEEGITVLQLLLDLQSDNKLPQNLSKSLNVDEWVDPIRERISTTMQLARLKLFMAQFDEAESLMRVGLSLAIEHTGKYTELACSVQHDLLGLIRRSPNHSDEDFYDFFMLCLDAAKETHNRIAEDIKASTDTMANRGLASTMPYARLLRVGLQLFEHSPTHKKLYYRLLYDCAFAWGEEQVMNVSGDYCRFIFNATELFLESGQHQKAHEVLYYADTIMNGTYLDPAPEIGYYLELQARVLLQAIEKKRFHSFPFFDHSDTSSGEANEETLEKSYDIINAAIDRICRSNDNKLEPEAGSICLNTLAFSQLLHGEFKEAEKNLLRVCSLLLPGFKEKDGALRGDVKKANPATLRTLSNSLCLLGSACDTRDPHSIQRAKQYFIFACRVLKEERLGTIFGKSSQFIELEDHIDRVASIQKCLFRLIQIQRSIFASSGSPTDKDELNFFKKHISDINESLSELQGKMQKMKDIANGILFKSGPDVTPVISDLKRRGLLTEDLDYAVVQTGQLAKE